MWDKQKVVLLVKQDSKSQMDLNIVHNVTAIMDILQVEETVY